MKYKNVELHNVAEVTAVGDGVRLQRVPELVRNELNPQAQLRVLEPNNCEIRFVSDDCETYITLSSEEETSVSLFYGTFDSRARYTIGSKPLTIRVSPEFPYDRVKILDRRWWGEQPFAPSVNRLICAGRQRAPLILHEIEGTSIRPPSRDELPKIRYLAYGTSITQGTFCDSHLNYVGQTAWHLGADPINLGVAGSCYSEPAFADYIADRTDWNIATLALSVNMHGFSFDEFRQRIAYMVNTVAASDTSRPVVCITLYPHFRDFGIEHPDFQWFGSPEEYRQALRDVANKCPLPNVHLIEGPELLTNIGGLAADLIHLSENANIEIGRNLSTRLKALL